MSRSFVAASSQHLTVDSVPLTAYPFSVAAWFKTPETALLDALLWIGNSASPSNYWVLGINWGTTGRVSFTVRNPSEFVAVSSTPYAVGAWQHACGVATSATARAAFLNGGFKGTNVTSATPTGANRISIGRAGDSTPNNFFDGLIAHTAIWNVALTDDEVAQLGAGVSPLLVRPAALVFYTPYLGRDDPELDVIGGRNLAVTGATSSTDEPPVQGMDASGGFLYEYERSMAARQRRQREQEELETQAQTLEDEVDREISQLLRAQEAKEGEWAELNRLQRMVQQYSNRDLRLTDRAKLAYVRALTQANFSSLEALDRELRRMLEEEEVAALMLFLGED